MTIEQMDLVKKVGQLIVFGFNGYEINDHVRRAIREYKLGNVILFTRNFKNAKQLFGLIEELQKEAMEAIGVPLLISIDQEGGSVTRLISEFTWFPGPMAIRAAGSPFLAEQVGEGIGAEMASYGMNLNLAPVVDLANDPDSAHVGGRSYGATPSEAAPYFFAHIQGLQRHVLATAKHFPSIGGSHVDLHLHLGRNDSPLERLEDMELAPGRSAVEANVEVIMTSHQIYSAIEDCPGTLSHEMLNGWLRKKYGFKGIIISDCMEMKALAAYCPTPEGCVRGVEAGVDLFLICHTESIQIESAQALLKAVIDGRISENRLDESVNRILQAKHRAVKQGIERQDPFTTPRFVANRKLTQDICESSLTLEGDSGFFRIREQDKVLVVAPPPVALTMVDTIVDGSEEAKRDLIAAVTQAFPAVDGLRYSLPLSKDEQELLLEAVRSGRYTKIMVAVYNAHMDEGQRMMMEQFLASKVPVGVMALRSPFDVRWCGRAAARLICYEYTPSMVRAIIRLLRGEIRANGKLPLEIERIS